MAEIGAQVCSLQSPFIVSFWFNIPGALDFSGRRDGVYEAVVYWERALDMESRDYISDLNLV